MSIIPEERVCVTIKYLVNLSEKAESRAEDADFPPGSTLEDVARYIRETRNISLPDPGIITTMNGKSWHQYPEKWKTSISRGDIILLLPMISGG